MSVQIDPAFDPVPSLSHEISVSVAADAPQGSARSVFVAAEGDLPASLPVGVDREGLQAAGFTGKFGQTFVLSTTPLTVLIGTGKGITSIAQLRDAVASFTRAARDSAHLSVPLNGVLATGQTGLGLDAELAAQAATEGTILARYKYDALKTDPKTVRLESLTLVLDEHQSAAETVERGVTRGLILARTASLARDLSNTPPRHLSAAKFAETIERLAPRFGLEAEVFDREQLISLGCGGLLGVNAGSVEEPRMVKLRYQPASHHEGTPHLALVGKGIMYDSGGISLKPSNAMHAAMKLDMSGAAAVFSAMTALREIGVTTEVTGWLMCTDNMPSGSATKLGDVLTIRGGTTVEVKNTDAEGRLVLADGLVLATEEDRKPSAIVDIATLTGAAMMALGTRNAAMLSNNDQLAEQLQAAAHTTDETVWRMPLDHRYRDQLKSDIADLSNIGGQYGGLILAALFLNEFVAGLPWGHLDIAGTMQSESDDLWRSIGSTGFGARLLTEFAAAFEPPTNGTDTLSGEDS